MGIAGVRVGGGYTQELRGAAESLFHYFSNWFGPAGAHQLDGAALLSRMLSCVAVSRFFQIHPHYSPLFSR